MSQQTPAEIEAEKRFQYPETEASYPFTYSKSEIVNKERNGFVKGANWQRSQGRELAEILKLIIAFANGSDSEDAWVEISWDCIASAKAALSKWNQGEKETTNP